VITSRIAVIASGTKPRRFFNHDISADIKKRIFYEIYPLTQVTDEKIVIIGSGDIAFDYALNLSSKGNEVIILNRGKIVKCLPWLWKRAARSEKISYRENTQIKNVQCHDDGLILICHNSTGECELQARYLVVAVGREPCLDFLSENLLRNLEKLQKANVLYMVGDVKNSIYRQTAICVGDGIKAAMVAHKKIIGEDL
jgi:thioredoxin reductase